MLEPPMDVEAASRTISETVIPKLEASSAFALDSEDNLARMRAVRQGLDAVLALLAVPAPTAARTTLRALMPVLEAAPGFRTTLRRNRNRFGETSLGASRAAVDAALGLLADEPRPEPEPRPGPEPQAQVLAPPALFRKAGVFVWQADAIAPEWLGQTLAANRFGWAMVLVHDGMAVQNESELQKGWLDRLRSQGTQVGAWGVCRTEPEREAELATGLVQRWGFEFYVANAEDEYEAFKGDQSRSGRFCTVFRQKLPALPAGFSTFGRVDKQAIDYVAWRNSGFVLLPQTYLNEREMDDPALCVEGAVAAGWPREHVFPTIGMYAGQRGRITPQVYADRLKAAGSTGFSIYLANQMDPADYTAFGSAIATLGIAA
jgi:hypothetical protein